MAQAAATRVMAGAVISTTSATMAAFANWVCSAPPCTMRSWARTVSTTAITRQPAAFGGGGTADTAVADKANKTKANADDVSN